MGAQGSTAVPWGCPWGRARSGGYARQGSCPGTLLPGTWEADLEGANPWFCRGSVYFTISTDSRTVSCSAPAAAATPSAAGHPAVPPRSRAKAPLLN